VRTEVRTNPAKFADVRLRLETAEMRLQPQSRKFFFSVCSLG